MKQKHIAILDFGSQYMHLISRRVRQLGVYAKIYPTDVNAHELRDAIGVIISGGPNDVNDQKLPYDPGLFDLPVPILGLCYGHQLMTFHLGGVVTPAHNREYGKATIHIQKKDSIFAELADEEQVWMSHWDSVTQVPEGFEVIATSPDSPVAAMANVAVQRYGFQFHPEVHHSTHGMKMLENFVFRVCGAEKNWSMDEYIEQMKRELREFVGAKKVFLLVSGGVDSAVAYAFLENILGKKSVYGLHIDNGMMRLNESALVKESLTAAGFDDLHIEDAGDRFLSALAGVAEPEQKRKIIGRVFLDVQREVFRRLELNPDEWLLGQGTIYPDTIESGGTNASDTIKTHHNRVEEIMEMINAGTVVEPLASLYKDEVRALGRQLGLPDALVNRWPFPGPGLGIRVLCASAAPDSIQGEARINTDIAAVLRGTGFFGTVVPLRSVGVQGDQRSYQHPAIITGVPIEKIIWKELDRLSVLITNKVVGVNRVMLQVGGSSDMHALTIKPGVVTRDRLDILRKADAAVDHVIRSRGLYDAIWQFPVILIPVSFAGGESIVLRPIESQEAMTVNFYPMAADVLQEIVNDILNINGVDAIFFDVTNKPPATIEWE